MLLELQLSSFLLLLLLLPLLLLGPRLAGLLLQKVQKIAMLQRQCQQQQQQAQQQLQQSQ